MIDQRNRTGYLLAILLSFHPLPGAGRPGQESLRQADRNQQRPEESVDYYDKWLEEDVVYIISQDERDVFGKLTTDQERDRFIEQFWWRRDTDPRSAENEYKIEHYRRIQYANDHFHAGIRGWRTDRGRVYILFGPPDRKESHPAGGWYQRKAHEGGGSTSTFPFEIWEYRHIEGVGSDIELEFVDPSASNLYRLTLDPQEKDEFLHVPGMGLTFREMVDPAFKGQKSRDRVLGLRSQGLLEHAEIVERAKDHPFQKQELMLKIANAPAIRYDDLKAMVRTAITYGELPFDVLTGFVRIDADDCLVALTVVLDNSKLAFESWAGRLRSTLQIYGLIRTLTKRVAFEFDDDIRAIYDGSELEGVRDRTAGYQRKVILKPGRYKLDLIIRDTVSGRAGTRTVGIHVPSQPLEKLTTSSVVLSSAIEPTGAEPSEPFVLGPFKISPDPDRIFDRKGPLGFYFEIYNFEVDQSSQQPALEVSYALTPRDGEPASYRAMRSGLGRASDRLYIARLVQLGELEPGRYDLVCKIQDRLKDESIVVREPFEVR